MPFPFERPVPLSLLASGPTAWFADGAGGPMSLPWPTSGMARALLETVLWKPRIRWVPRQVLLLSPLRYRRVPCPLDVPSIGLQKGMPLLVLEQVHYRIDAELWLNAQKAPKGEADNHRKYAEMFLRRLAQQRPFRPAYFGLESFPAHLSLATGEEEPLPLDLSWGPMPGDTFGEPIVDGTLRAGRVVFPTGNTDAPTSPWPPAPPPARCS
jgi:hypothetical protein